jgi:hypothetical protein
MKSEGLVIDADGHILEPPDLWEKYLEPKYRPNAIRITVGDDGYEYLEVAGRRAGMTRPGALGTLGGMGKQVEESRRRREKFVGEGRAAELRYERPRPEDTYLKGAAFGTMDMKERLQLLDKEGMAKALPLPDARPALGMRNQRPGAIGGVLPRLQPLDRGFLPRLRRSARSDRSPIAGRSR